jgi:hypothetical protein
MPNPLVISAKTDVVCGDVAISLVDTEGNPLEKADEPDLTIKKKACKNGNGKACFSIKVRICGKFDLVCRSIDSLWNKLASDSNL